jgi:acyl-CoA hydrolase
MPDSSHQLSMTILMTPDMANFSGNVHGGMLLKLLDQVAYACASRYAGHYVVTKSVDQVIFKAPIYVGELVDFLASVNHTGKSSVEVGVRVISEDIHTKTRRHTNSCYFTMVAIDEKGAPVKVPPFVPKNALDKRRHQAALIRKELREEFKRKYDELHQQSHPEGYDSSEEQYNGA